MLIPLLDAPLGPAAAAGAGAPAPLFFRLPLLLLLSPLGRLASPRDVRFSFILPLRLASAVGDVGSFDDMSSADFDFPQFIVSVFTNERFVDGSGRERVRSPLERSPCAGCKEGEASGRAVDGSLALRCSLPNMAVFIFTSGPGIAPRRGSLPVAPMSVPSNRIV